jgi:hypothetical protein
VHLHTLFLDGVYEVLPRSSGVRFRPLPPPDAEEVATVLADVARRLVRALDEQDSGAPGGAESLSRTLNWPGLAGRSDRRGQGSKAPPSLQKGFYRT